MLAKLLAPRIVGWILILLVSTTGMSCVNASCARKATARVEKKLGKAEAALDQAKLDLEAERTANADNQTAMNTMQAALHTCVGERDNARLLGETALERMRRRALYAERELADERARRDEIYAQNPDCRDQADRPVCPAIARRLRGW